MKKQEPINLDHQIKQANLVKKLKAGIDLIRSLPPKTQENKITKFWIDR